MNVVEFFRTNRDIDDLEEECHTQCYISVGIWITLFLSGVLFQYKCTSCGPTYKKSNKQTVECYKSESDPKSQVANENDNLCPHSMDGRSYVQSYTFVNI